MINEKLGLFTYYDFEFKRNFVLRELNRVLDEKLSELGKSETSKLTLKEKVNLIDSSINSILYQYLKYTYL